MTDRRQFLATSGALLLSACATTPLGKPDTTEVAAPKWSVGDSWTYRRIDAYNGLDRGTVARTVESVSGKGIRVVARHAHGAVSEDALFASPGIQMSGALSEDRVFVGGYAPSLRLHDFPLVSGKRWEQQLICTDSNQSRHHFAASTQVEGWEDLPLAGRTYRAIIVRRTLHLDTRLLYRASLHREELEWYVPEIGAGARLRIFEWLVFSFHTAPGYRLNVQLESFKRV